MIIARDWQAVAYAQCGGHPLVLIQAPGGSGKSAIQCMLGAGELVTNPLQRQLILVPQCHINTMDRGESSATQVDSQHLIDNKLFL